MLDFIATIALIVLLTEFVIITAILLAIFAMCMYEKLNNQIHDLIN